MVASSAFWFVMHEVMHHSREQEYDFLIFLRCLSGIISSCYRECYLILVDFENIVHEPIVLLPNGGSLNLLREVATTHILSVVHPESAGVPA